MIKATKQDLKTIEIQVVETGFVLWVTEIKDKKKCRHWMLDGSEVNLTGEIQIGDQDVWNLNAVHDPSAKMIRIMRKPDPKEKKKRRIRIIDLSPGEVFRYEETLALKTEYITEKGVCECMIIGSGEMFWAGMGTAEKLNNLLVEKVEIETK